MKHPIKTKRLLLFTLSAGVLGFILRLWLLGSTDEKGLLSANHPAGILCFILCAIVFAVLAFYTLSLSNTPEGGQLFPSSPVLLAGNILCAAGLAVNSIVEVFTDFQGIILLCSFTGLAAAASILYGAVCRHKRQKPSLLFHGIVTIYLMLHMVVLYRHWSILSQLQTYFFPLLASVFAILTLYCRTALDGRIGSRKKYVFFNQAALFCSLLSIPGRQWLFFSCIALWCGMNLCSLRPAKRPLMKNKNTMLLPEDVLLCIRTLENAGFDAYVVGGCVRDSLLGIPPHDYDLCTSATPEEIIHVFGDFNLVRNGEKHGTIGVIINGNIYEITTFRTEGAYTDGRHPDYVAFVPDIKEDLLRRDFTVNAIAYAPGKGFIDPWGGRKDLQQQILRAVGDPESRFTEDSLRILRGVRFAVRFDLTIEPETLSAMERLTFHMERLARERVFDELCKLLPMLKAKDLLQYAPIITGVIPELAPTVGFCQHSPHHAYDVYTHTAYVVESCPKELAIRWAALLHDIGKVPTFTLDENGRGHFYGHAKVSAQMAEDVLRRLKAPNALREKVLFLIENHMLELEPDKKLLRHRLGQCGNQYLFALLALQKADATSKGMDDPVTWAHFDKVEAKLEEILAEKSCLTAKDLEINGRDILSLGYAPGPQIGNCMTFLLNQVQSEAIPNRREELLDAAKAFLRREE